MSTPSRAARDDKHDDPEHIRLHRVFEEEYEAVFGLDADTSAAGVSDEVRLSEIRRKLNDACPAALCLSGGGIRSATFGLGVLQGLAKRRLLQKFHYLSTVSGGGFLGGFLSAWMHHDGPDAPVSALAGIGGRASAEVEPRPLRHLREFSNYLSPRPGLFSADTWTLAFTYVRNLVLNWLVFLPLLAALLMLPRMVVATINLSRPLVDEAPEWRRWVLPLTALLVAGLLAAEALYYIAKQRPIWKRADVAASDAGGQGGFLLYCLPFLLAAALALSLAYAWSTAPYYITGRGEHPAGPEADSAFWKRLPLPAFLGVALALNVVSWFLGEGRAKRTDHSRRSDWELVVAVATGVLSGLLLYQLTRSSWFDPVDHPRAYATFAVPGLLAVFLLNITLSNGLLSIYASDETREWWSRIGGLILLAVVGWWVVHVLVLFAPSWALWALGQVGTVSAGVAVSALAAMLGRSGETPPNAEQTRRAGKTALVKRAALALAAPAAIVAVVILLALGTNWLLDRGPWLERARIDFLKGEARREARRVEVELAKADREKEIKAWNDAVEEHDDIASATVPVTSEVLLPVMPDAHEQVVKSSRLRLLLPWLIALAGLGLAFSYFININKFSLHTSWRNRITRAYLGASRTRRTSGPNYDGFTGFDPDDNLTMWHLWYGPVPLLRAIRERYTQEGSAAHALYHALAREIQALIGDPDEQVEPAVAEAVATAVDALLAAGGPERDKLVEALPALGIAPGETLGEIGLDRARRILINLLHPEGRRPLHVVNIALNLVSGTDLAWQQRKAESFTASTLHCGSGSVQFPEADGGASSEPAANPTATGPEVRRLGYRSSTRYGGLKRYYGSTRGRPITLGTAVALSGAAVNPSMGYHSSPPVTFLMTLFNVRLGAWLGNPGPAGKHTYTKPHPVPAFLPLLREALGMSDSTSGFVQLSDGGHFENLGLYEMVRRQCRIILVSDAGQDPPFSFSDLGNAVRKIYIDMGVPIEFEQGFTLRLRPRGERPEKNEPTAVRCSLARIHYSALETSPRLADGYLLYVKPTFYGDEPVDVYNYAKGVEDFPHETTADQFFSESQFESYRRLGEFIVDRLFEEGPAPESPTGDAFDVLGRLDVDTLGARVFWATPTEAGNGTEVTLRGIGFNGKTRVTLMSDSGEVAATAVFVDPTTLTFTVPELKGHAKGNPVDVTVNIGGASPPLTLKAAFRYDW